MTTVDWIDRGARRGDQLLVCGDMGVLSVQLQARGTTLRGQIAAALDSDASRSELQIHLTTEVVKQFGPTCYAGLLDFDQATLTLSAPIIATSAEFRSSDVIAEQAGRLLGGVVADWTLWFAERLDQPAHYALRPAWAPAAEVADSASPTISESKDGELKAKLARLLRRRQEARRGRYLGLIATLASSFVILFAIAIGFAYPDFLIFAVAAGGYAALYLGIGLFGWISGTSSHRDAESDIRRITDEIDLRHMKEEEQEQRAQKLFLAHGSDLKRYYDQALRQAKYVYYVGVASLLLGVLVVAAAFALIFSDSNATLSQQIIVGSLGAIAALLSNYIAVIYLRMFSGSVTAMTGFHSRLVSTHHLHFANLLTAKIDDEKIRHAALAEMAAGLSRAPAQSEAVPGFFPQPEIMPRTRFFGRFRSRTAAVDPR